MGGFGGNPSGNGSGGASAQHRGRAGKLPDDGGEADRSGLHAGPGAWRRPRGLPRQGDAGGASCVTREMSKAAARNHRLPLRSRRRRRPMGPAKLRRPSLLRRRARSPTSRRFSTRKSPIRQDRQAQGRGRRRADKEASPTALAQFYYDRGNARSALGRNREALADGEKALEVGKRRDRVASGDPHPPVRRHSAQRARRSEEGCARYFRATVREGNQPGQRGYADQCPAQHRTALVLMGDIAQAEAYMRRNAALVQDAREQPHPNCEKRLHDLRPRLGGRRRRRPGADLRGARTVQGSGGRL